MKRMIVLFIIFVLLVLPSVALAQEPGAESTPDPFPIAPTVLWLVGLFTVWMTYSAMVPTVLEVAKEQFLDKVLRIVWSLLRAAIGLFMDENTRTFETTFNNLRGYIIIAVVVGGAYVVADQQYTALMQGAPDNIALMESFYVKLGLTAFLAGGAFLFHKRVIKESFPAPALSLPIATVAREAA